MHSPARFVTAASALLGTLALSLALLAPAAAFPTAPVRILVLSTITDADYRLAAALAEALSHELGGKVVVDAHGADGAPGFVASTRDGHTLLLVRDTVLTRNPHTSPKTALAEADVGSITVIGEEVLVLGCHADAGIRSAADWRARRTPAKLRLGVLDDPSHTPFAFALSRDEPTRFEAAAYAGADALGKALVAKSIDCAVLPLATAKDALRRGAVHALGVSTATPAPQLPGVPVLRAALAIDVTADTYLLALQAGLAQPVRDTLEAAVARAVKRPELVRRLVNDGFVVTPATPADARSLVRRRHAFWAEQTRGKR